MESAVSYYQEKFNRACSWMERICRWQQVTDRWYMPLWATEEPKDAHDEHPYYSEIENALIGVYVLLLGDFCNSSVFVLTWQSCFTLWNVDTMIPVLICTVKYRFEPIFAIAWWNFSEQHTFYVLLCDAEFGRNILEYWEASIKFDLVDFRFPDMFFL